MKEKKKGKHPPMENGGKPQLCYNKNMLFFSTQFTSL